MRNINRHIRLPLTHHVPVVQVNNDRPVVRVRPIQFKPVRDSLMMVDVGKEGDGRWSACYLYSVVESDFAIKNGPQNVVKQSY